MVPKLVPLMVPMLVFCMVPAYVYAWMVPILVLWMAPMLVSLQCSNVFPCIVPVLVVGSFVYPCIGFLCTYVGLPEGS